MNATSCFAHASSTPCFSGPRRRRLYSFCTLTNRAQPWSAEMREDSSIISGEKLLQPISRTLPARTSASSAPSVSSSGVAGSGKWS